MKVDEGTGKVVLLNKEEKLREAERIMKVSEVLERETKFLMEKSLRNLNQLEHTIQDAYLKRPQAK